MRHTEQKVGRLPTVVVARSMMMKMIQSIHMDHSCSGDTFVKVINVVPNFLEMML